MRKIARVLAAVLLLAALGVSATAQEKQKVQVGLLKQDGNTVSFTITSPQQFYVGGNNHILYIGDKHYDLYDQQNEEDGGRLKFFIPSEDFAQFKSGENIFLSYGELNLTGGQTPEDLCAENFCPCWSLGKLNKKLLK